MNVWLVILLAVVSVAAVFYFLVAVLGVKSDKLLGPPLAIAIVVVLLAGLSYYLLGEKSIYVVIETDDRVLQKRAIAFNDDILNTDDVFVFSSVTRGIAVIDYKQQVKEFLAADEVKLCKNYGSESVGSGRYKKEAASVTICVTKKGARWSF